MNLGEHIKKARQERGITQKILAERVGVSQPMINYYEKGIRTPSVSTLVNIAKELNVSVDSLTASA